MEKVEKEKLTKIFGKGGEGKIKKRLRSKNENKSLEKVERKKWLLLFTQSVLKCMFVPVTT